MSCIHSSVVGRWDCCKPLAIVKRAVKNYCFQCFWVRTQKWMNSLTMIRRALVTAGTLPTNRLPLLIPTPSSLVQPSLPGQYAYPYSEILCFFPGQYFNI